MRLLTNPSGAQGPRNAASCREKVQRDSSRCLLLFCPPFSVDNMVHLWLGGWGPRGTAEEPGAAPRGRSRGPPLLPRRPPPRSRSPAGAGGPGPRSPGEHMGGPGRCCRAGRGAGCARVSVAGAGRGGLSPAAVNLSWFLRGAAGQR